MGCASSEPLVQLGQLADTTDTAVSAVNTTEHDDPPGQYNTAQRDQIVEQLLNTST